MHGSHLDPKAPNTRATSHSDEQRPGDVRTGGRDEDQAGQPGGEAEELGRERQRVREHLQLTQSTLLLLLRPALPLSRPIPPKKY
jgi:hypothetical protein